MPGEIVSGARRVSLESILERGARAASGFSAAGIGMGDTVAILMRNDPVFFEASVAAGLLGAYPVPINWHYTAEEAEHVLTDSGAKALVVHADLYPRVKPVIPADVTVLVVETGPEIAEAFGLDPAACKVPSGARDWHRWTDALPPWDGPLVELPSTMIYTSGTTGKPKGVRRAPATQPVQEYNVALLTKLFGTAPGMRTVLSGPLYHSAPNAYGLTAMRAGGTVILQPRFDPEEMLRLIEAEKITHLYMVPTMFVRLLKLPEELRGKYDVSSLVNVIHAAAPCPPEVKKRMLEWWGPVVNEFYGSTETSGVTYCTGEEWLAHPGTVGRPVLDATVRIIGEDGSALGPNQIGEVYARHWKLSDFTYHGDASKRAGVEKDGLITSGDVGYMNEAGFLFLCDRKKDMVISGGVNIYPAEIEACLHTMPGVHDCAVFGIPDEEYGEALAAVVQPMANAGIDAAAVKAHVRQHLAGYKVPKVVEFAAELPREDSGKIFKRKLREPYWANAGRSI
jgi:long-chain acyl-CoA synthetase